MRIIGIDHGSKESLVKECGAEVFIDITKFDDKSIAEEVKKVTGGMFPIPRQKDTRLVYITPDCRFIEYIVADVCSGLGASAVIVCTASNKAYAQALDFLRFGGTLVCVGMPEGDSVPIAKAFPAASKHEIPYSTSSLVLCV